MEFESERQERIKYLDDMIEQKRMDYYALKDKIESLNHFLLVAVKANTMIKELDTMVNEIVSRK